MVVWLRLVVVVAGIFRHLFPAASELWMGLPGLGPLVSAAAVNRRPSAREPAAPGQRMGLFSVLALVRVDCGYYLADFCVGLGGLVSLLIVTC